MNRLQDQELRISSKRTPEKVRSLTAEDLLSFEESPAAREQELPVRELIVEGLLSFSERTSFQFGRLNILVGPNGSGKSNLIDCLRIFRFAPLDIQVAFKDSGFEEWLYRDSIQQAGKALLQLSVGLSTLPAMILHQIKFGPPRNSRAQLEEAIAGDGAESSIQYFVGSYRSDATLSVAGMSRRRRERKMGEREYDPFQSILSQVRDFAQYPEITLLAGLYANFRIYSEWSFGRNSTLREATPTSRSDTTLSESMDDLALALNGLEGTVAHEKIKNLLKELKETYADYATRILFGRVGLELVETPFDRPLPATRLSDGTLRFLALAAILFQPNPPPLICLEEPELGMHPDMIRIVARMIVEASTKTQLIITTHSEQLLTALQDDFDALFAFDAGLAGSVVRQFSHAQYQDWRQEHTLGELWTSGELGGNRW